MNLRSSIRLQLSPSCNRQETHFDHHWEEENRCPFGIDFLSDKTNTTKDILDTLKHNKSAISYYLRRKGKKPKPKTLGRPPKLTQRAVRVLVNIASNGCMTARKVLQQSGMQIAVLKAQRVLQQSQYMTFGHLKVCSVLKPPQIEARKNVLRITRLQWALSGRK